MTRWRKGMSENFQASARVPEYEQNSAVRSHRSDSAPRSATVYGVRMSVRKVTRSGFKRATLLARLRQSGSARARASS